MYFQSLRKLLSRYLLIISSLVISSCGFVGDEPVKNGDIYQNSELAGGCKINANSFTKVMEEDIEEQIKCLEKNFEQFSKYVKRPNLDQIGRRELSVFVSDFFPKDASAIMDGLTLLFKVNLVFIDDQSDRISTEGMRRLFTLLAAANKNAARLNQAFKKYDEGKLSLVQLRTTFIDVFTNLANAAISSMSHGKSAQISIDQTIKDVAGRFKNLALSEDDIRAIQIIKKIFIGGQADILTCDELRDFLTRMNPLASLVFDITYIKDYKLDGAKGHTQFALDRVDILFDNIPLDRSEIILSHSDAGFLSKYSGMDIDHAAIEKTIRSAKSHLLTTNQSGEGLNGHDFKLIKIYAKSYFTSFLTWNEIENALTLENIPNRDYFAGILLKWSTNLNKLIDPALFPEEVGLSYFLDELAETWGMKNKDIQLGRSIMLLKPLLIGGKAATLSPLEVDRLLPKLNELGMTVFDTVMFARKENSKREWYRFALEILDKTNTLLHDGDDFEIAFLTKPLENFKVFVPEDKIKFMTGVIEGFPAIKAKLFGGHKEVVIFKEFRALVNEIRSMIETLHLTEVTLDLYPNEFKSPKLVHSLPYRHHAEYARFSSTRIARFKQDFKYVFSKFHYFLDEESLQTYKSSIVRTRSGFSLNMLLRQAARLVIGKYGHEENGHVMLSMDEIDSMMKEFKPLLEPMGLWTKKIDTFARNMLLLSDLFQSRSNGNGAMDVDEAVEYIGMVFVAAEIQTRMMKTYANYCDNLGSKEAPAYATDCYRPIFFKLMFNDLKLGKKLPKLKNYIETSSSEESIQFLRGVEGFARDIDDESIPMAKRDLVLLIGAMLNIESTFVRFDRVNENNQLDENELDQAYFIYRSGIIAVAGLTPDQEQYTKSIFLYMVDKMAKPSKFDLFVFHNNPLRDNVIAKRLNIGTLLYYLVQE